MEVESVDYTDTMDPGVRVDRLLAILEREDGDCVLVGSSMGGYVALAASIEVPVRGVFLMAPALYISGYEVQDYPTRADNVDIVHGWNDDIVPVDNSIRYARACKATLHIVDGDHRLTANIDEICAHLTRFIEQLS